jgi:hypothetical protein
MKPKRLAKVYLATVVEQATEIERQRLYIAALEEALRRANKKLNR